MTELLNCPNRCIVRRDKDLGIIQVQEFKLVPEGAVTAGKYQVSERVEPTAVICNRCGLRGPVKNGEVEAARAWNNLPRDKRFPTERDWDKWDKTEDNAA